MGVIDSLSPFDSEAIGVTNAKIINNLTVDIVNNSYGKPEIAMSEEVFRDLKLAKQQNYEAHLLARGHGGRRRATSWSEMFEETVRAPARPTFCEERRGSSPIFQSPRAQPGRRRRATIVPAEYLAGEPNQIVVDYLASMTDRYFTSHVSPTCSPRAPCRIRHPRLLRRPLGLKRPSPQRPPH